MAEIASSDDPNTIFGGVARSHGTQVYDSPATCFLEADISSGRYLAGNNAAWRGNGWANGVVSYTGVNTLLPPNSPSCMQSSNDHSNGQATATSRHPGGVNVVLADGSVHFISRNIDTGNLSAKDNQNADSPYGIWGALGSIAGGEPPSSY